MKKPVKFPDWRVDSNWYMCDCWNIVHFPRYVWKNQYGFCTQMICKHCGRVTRITYTEKKGWSKEGFQRPTTGNCAI